jgi:hypothetical protein
MGQFSVEKPVAPRSALSGNQQRRYENFTDIFIPRGDTEAPMTLPYRHFLSLGMIDMMIRNCFVRWYAPDGAMLQRPVNIAYMTDVAKAILGSDERERRLEAAPFRPVSLPSF